MLDTHYDLLTILYYCYIKKDFSYIEKIKEDFKNIDGVIANLYFMEKERMIEELGIEEFDVYEMFKISTNLAKEYFKDNKIIFSIEGCDYIEDEQELENLYKLGLRNILLVWNNENKYGSGNKSNKGLTDLGKSFIKKAVSLGISIDLSHMNKNTFWDTIELLDELKSKGQEVKVLASHSNSYNICQNKRNLDDRQILAIKKLNGIIGLVSYGPFIDKDEKDLENNYLKHIKHVENLMGIDNMDFVEDLLKEDEDISLYKHSNIKDRLTRLLSSYYNKEEIEKIMYRNIEKYFEIQN